MPKSWMRTCWMFSMVLVGIATMPDSRAALLTQLGSEAEFTSDSVIIDTFSSPLGTATEYSFDATAGLFPSNDNQLARSGITYLGDNSKPLTVTFNADVFEVGAYMGNDDDDAFRFGSVFFGQVDFFLDAYDTGGALLGTVMVAGTGNDLIDQFLGVRSDVALGSVVFRNTSDYFNPGIALDDFAIGLDSGRPTPVPAPSVLVLIGLGLLLLLPWRGPESPGIRATRLSGHQAQGRAR